MWGGCCFLEVKGYADAAEWMYRQAVHPTGLAEHGKIITLAEVRGIHRTAMSPVWEAAPHRQTGDGEGPGSYRRHDIHTSPGGMTPVSWPLIGSELAAWKEEVDSLCGDRLSTADSCAADQRGRLPVRGPPVIPGCARRCPLPIRTDTPIRQRQRLHRQACGQPDTRTARIPARGDLQARPIRMP